jgi:hypothetical protein
MESGISYVTVDEIYECKNFIGQVGEDKFKTVAVFFFAFMTLLKGTTMFGFFGQKVCPKMALRHSA